MQTLAAERDKRDVSHQLSVLAHVARTPNAAAPNLNAMRPDIRTAVEHVQTTKTRAEELAPALQLAQDELHHYWSKSHDLELQLLDHKREILTVQNKNQKMAAQLTGTRRRGRGNSKVGPAPGFGREPSKAPAARLGREPSKATPSVT